MYGCYYCEYLNRNRKKMSDMANYLYGCWARATSAVGFQRVKTKKQV